MKSLILKEAASILIAETDINTSDKKNLLFYIKNEATDHDLMSLLLNGKIPEKMSEDYKNIIEARFNSIMVEPFIVKMILHEKGVWTEPMKFGLQTSSGPEVAKNWKRLGVGVLAGWVAYRALKGVFNEKSRRCGIFGFGAKRKACMAQVATEIGERRLNILNQIKTKCKGEPKCLAKVEAKIASVRKEIGNKSVKMAKMVSKGKQLGSPSDTMKLV
jgi:hypothetical protein